MKQVKLVAALLVVGLLLSCELNPFKKSGGDDGGDVSTTTLADGTVVTTVQKPVEVNGTNMIETTVFTTSPNGSQQTNVTYESGVLSISNMQTGTPGTMLLIPAGESNAVPIPVVLIQNTNNNNGVVQLPNGGGQISVMVPPSGAGVLSGGGAVHLTGLSTNGMILFTPQQ